MKRMLAYETTAAGGGTAGDGEFKRARGAGGLLHNSRPTREGRKAAGPRRGRRPRSLAGLPVVVLTLLPAAALAAGTIADVVDGATDASVRSVLPDRLSRPVAIELALAANPTLAAMEARVNAARGRAWQAGRWSNPALTFAVEEWPVDEGGGFDDAKQTVGVQQQLPWPGKPGLDHRLGATAVRLRNTLRRLQEVELVRDVKVAFARTLAARESVAIGEQLVALAESSATTAGRRVGAGAAPLQEQLRTEVQLARVRADAAGLRRDLAKAQHGLAALLGRPDLTGVELEGDLPAGGDDRLLQAAPAGWPDEHPSVVAAILALDRAELGYRRARLEPYPDITAGVAGGRLGETDRSIVEFSLSIPLPLIDSSRGRKDEAAANVGVAGAELRGVRVQLAREWAVARQRYRTAAEQAASYRDEILPKTDEALRLVQAGFDEGKFGFIDLLDTQRTTAQTRFAFQQVRLDLAIARAELEALLETSPDAPRPMTFPGQRPSRSPVP